MPVKSNYLCGDIILKITKEFAIRENWWKPNIATTNLILLKNFRKFKL
jgi:hypothetical protein